MRLSSAAAMVAVAIQPLPVFARAQQAPAVPSQTAPAPMPTAPLRTPTYVGCFTSSESFADQGGYIYQSSGNCQKVCVNLNKPVMGMTTGSNCWCGDSLPASASKTDDGQCDVPCQGFGDEKCGGDHTWTVWLTGLKPKVANADATSSSSSSKPASTTPPPTSTRSATPQVVTVGGVTQTVTSPVGDATETAAAAAGPKPSGASTGASTGTKAGIAIGVVIGVLAIVAIAGALFFWTRTRRRHALEEEHRRNAEISRFMAGGKKESTSATSDARLEPSVMQRRMSDGSIADNQDYSRRILKVTNPDGT
ncbi:MAG: hypothetical protein M1826_003836 [Phylliscum demangeonii]|nr:MAG: hypothetical protein M1826_003836 [Phylliscum demangeonii]